ncbi:MAG: hypothetical protein ACRDF4_00045, partial [Rhabdochlamydiaceae bacterium]
MAVLSSRNHSNIINCNLTATLPAVHVAIHNLLEQIHTFQRLFKILSKNRVHFLCPPPPRIIL